jgi:hypothetical protein
VGELLSYEASFPEVPSRVTSEQVGDCRQPVTEFKLAFPVP